MRKALMTTTAAALVTGAAMWLAATAGAQGGGTIEADVKYNGAPVVEKLKVNKDTEKCGTEATIDKVVVGGNKGTQDDNVAQYDVRQAEIAFVAGAAAAMLSKSGAVSYVGGLEIPAIVNDAVR